MTPWDGRRGPYSDRQGRVLLEPAPAGPVTVSCVMPARQWSVPSVDIVVAPGGRAAAQLLSVERLVEDSSTTDIDFDWRVTAPRIAAVPPDSSAAKAGFLAGDLVVAVDGVSVDGLNAEGVRNLITDRAAGLEVSLTVLRGSQRKTLTLKTQPVRW